MNKNLPEQVLFLKNSYGPDHLAMDVEGLWQSLQVSQ